MSELAVVKGQPTSVGSDLMTLTPARYHVLGTVEPVQLYRLLGAPTEGSVTIPGGPAPFTCTGLEGAGLGGRHHERAVLGSGGSGRVRRPPGAARHRHRHRGRTPWSCRRPRSAAARARASCGWTTGDGSELEERPITLGVSDGTNIEVTEGLAEGEQIRQFVPGLAAASEDPSATTTRMGERVLRRAGSGAGDARPARGCHQAGAPRGRLAASTSSGASIWTSPRATTCRSSGAAARASRRC